MQAHQHKTMANTGQNMHVLSLITSNNSPKINLLSHATLNELNAFSFPTLTGNQ